MRPAGELVKPGTPHNANNAPLTPSRTMPSEVKHGYSFAMKFVLVVLALLLAVLQSPSSVASDESEIMTFSLVPPEQPVMLFGDAWRIYADGFIDSEAANRLEGIIKENNISPYSVIYLDSLGGSLFGGIELGRVIKKYGLSTSVGSNVGRTERQHESARCFSACALAYLGGTFRYFSDRHAFGVHRFYSVDRFEDGEDRAQIISAYILNYLKEVGTPEQFFIEMTRAGPRDMVLLSKAELERIGVVNNGFEAARWSLEALPEPYSALYLKGERDTRYGMNKFLMLCEPEKGELFLHIIFDPQGRQDEVLAMPAMSLIIDSDYYPFDEFLRSDRRIVNEWLNAAFTLNDQFVEKIARSNTVGMAFQWAYDAPIFLGFQGMEFDGGRALFSGLRAACAR